MGGGGGGWGGLIVGCVVLFGVYFDMGDVLVCGKWGGWGVRGGGGRGGGRGCLVKIGIGW